MDIGKQIKSCRDSLGLTQGEFCRRYNLKYPTEKLEQSVLSRYEKGAITPSAERFVKCLSLRERPDQ